MKKFIKLFFSFLLSFLLIYSFYPIKSYAANLKDSTISKQGVQVICEGNTTVKANSSSIKKNNSNKVSSQINSMNTTSSATNTDLGYETSSVTIHWSLQADNINRTIIDSFTIENITGVVPEELDIYQDLEYADENLDSLTFTISTDYHASGTTPVGVSLMGSEIKVGITKSEVVPAQTKFWSIRGYAGAFYPTDNPYGSVGSWTRWEPSYVAINRTGNIFPDYTDPWSHKKASDGLHTNWTKVANPVDWNNVTRGTAISQYINSYGDPKWDWSQYQIHHIQPRTYGGTNDIDNLIPIPAPQHTLITSWFNGY